MNKHLSFKLVFAAILLFTFSCVSNKPNIATREQVSLSPRDHFTKMVEDSNITEIFSKTDYNKFYNSFFNSGKRKDTDRNYVLQFKSPAALLYYTFYDFNLANIPQDAMIISAKLYSYIIEGEDMLGHVRYQINKVGLNDYSADIAGKWLVLDITDTFSNLLKGHHTELNLSMKMDGSGLGSGRRAVSFASSRAGSHVAPRIIVEYILEK